MSGGAGDRNTFLTDEVRCLCVAGVGATGEIVTDEGLSQTAAAFDPAVAKTAGQAFSVMFAMQALALAISLACFLKMEERPLRGSAPSAPVLAE